LITNNWVTRKNTEEIEVKDISKDMFIWKNLKESPESECFFEKPEKEHYSSQTSICLTRVVFNKINGFQETTSTSRIQIHKTGSLIEKY